MSNRFLASENLKECGDYKGLGGKYHREYQNFRHRTYVTRQRISHNFMGSAQHNMPHKTGWSTIVLESEPKAWR
jgi:hypothetical protein